jgi:catechol 2,3-dioxygenase-like lactoylglutathione lyase family enzyme
MKPTFIYVPTDDLEGTARFYNEVLGFVEAWREGDDTVAFAIPDSELLVMVSTSPGAQGLMYLVPSVEEWLSQHSDLKIAVPLEQIPDGAVVGLTDHAGNAFYVFDQKEE